MPICDDDAHMLAFVRAGRRDLLDAELQKRGLKVGQRLALINDLQHEAAKASSSPLPQRQELFQPEDKQLQAVPFETDVVELARQFGINLDALVDLARSERRAGVSAQLKAVENLKLGSRMKLESAVLAAAADAKPPLIAAISTAAAGQGALPPPPSPSPAAPPPPPPLRRLLSSSTASAIGLLGEEFASHLVPRCFTASSAMALPSDSDRQQVLDSLPIASPAAPFSRHPRVQGYEVRGGQVRLSSAKVAFQWASKFGECADSRCGCYRLWRPDVRRHFVRKVVELTLAQLRGLTPQVSK